MILWKCWIFSFPNLFFLVPRLIIGLYFSFLMTGSALNLAFKLVVLHVELENVKHGVLLDVLVEVSETQLLFHWIGIKKLVYKINMWSTTLLVNYTPKYQGGGGGPQPILDKNSPTGIGLKWKKYLKLVSLFINIYFSLG